MFSLDGHKVHRTHHKKIDGVGLSCDSKDHSNNVAAPCPITIGLMRNAGDAPLKSSEYEHGVLVPLLKNPRVSAWQVKSLLSKPEGSPSHILMKVSVTVDKRQHGMAFVHASPIGFKGNYRFIGMLDPRHDGRWAIRDLILNYLVSRYREVPLCSGEFHDKLDFSEKDIRRKDPTNLSILVDTMFLEFTQSNRCSDCFTSSLVPPMT